ncbi:hypothetical protein B9T07_20505 [Limnospira fusiformis CCALA 023]
MCQCNRELVVVGWVKRSATQQSRVKCWVTLHSVHPTKLCDRSGFVGWVKRSATQQIRSNVG